MVIGHQVGSLDVIALLTFLAGCALIGASFSIITIAASYYPTLSRGTGIAWMMGVGRVGGILGATVGGVVLQEGWNFNSIFSLLSVPAFCAGVSLLLAIPILMRVKQRQTIVAVSR